MKKNHLIRLFCLVVLLISSVIGVSQKNTEIVSTGIVNNKQGEKGKNVIINVDGPIQGTMKIKSVVAPAVKAGISDINTFTGIEKSNQQDGGKIGDNIPRSVLADTNLTPYQPSAWDNKIVLSVSTGTNTSSSVIYDNQTIYLDWAITNNSVSNISHPFYSKLYVDGVLIAPYYSTSLNSYYYTYMQDVAIGPLSAGAHTFKIIADSENNVIESNETDNEFEVTKIITSSANCQNLSPYQPNGWTDKIVISSGTGTNISSATIYDNQSIYLDWAVVNAGTCNVTKSFNSRLYVDDILKATYTTSSLNANYYSYYQDISIGLLTAGSHTFRIVVDADNVVNEYNEADNEFTITKIITSSVGCSNLLPYQPTGWDDRLVLSTVTGSNISSVTFYDNQPIYLDWAATNSGGCNITTTFSIKIYVDAILKANYNISGMLSNYYNYIQDLSVGTLTPGEHTFKIVVDADNVVSEGNETDNEYLLTRTILLATPDIYLTPRNVSINQISKSSPTGPSYVFVDNSRLNPVTAEFGLQSELNLHMLGCITPDSVINYWRNRKSVIVSSISLPPVIDWSNNDSPVKNQGSCGSCWAFAATALIENLSIQSDLSEQVVVSCSGAGSCSGGSPYTALKYYQSTGVPAETCYPYTQLNGTCNEMCTYPEFKQKISDVSNYLWGLTTVDNLKEKLQYGPLSVQMLVPTGNTFYGYTGGVYDYNGGSISSATQSHAILLVGYDDNQKCFKAKNSWGAAWGESGYFRIAYDDVTDDVQFGSYAISASGAREQYFSNITNLGRKNLTIQSISTDSDWINASGYPVTPFSIIPSGSQALIIDIDWTLLGPASKTGKIVIFSDDPDELTDTIWITANPVSCGTVPVPLIDKVEQPTCKNATANINLTGLPATGTWTIKIEPSGTSSLGTGTTSILAGLGEGTYKFKVTNSSGCTSEETDDVIINSQPKTPVTPVITQEGTILHSNAVNGNQWYDEIGNIAGANSQDYAVARSGQYYDIVTVTGCSSEKSNTINVIITETDLIQNIGEIRVYPNPVSNELVIESSGMNGTTGFEILNAGGKVIYQSILSGRAIVATGSFAPGLYIIRLANGNKFEFKKVIKQ